MNYEPVTAIGWAKPDKKPQPVLILYVGDDVEAGRDAVNSALDSNVVAFGRVFRGQLGGGQLMFAASLSNRPAAPGPVLPPTGAK
jgi:hypothetical protein